MNTEDFKLECAECYLTDECDAMYGGMNPPCAEVALQSASDNKQIDVISLRDVNEVLTPYTGKIKEDYLLDIMEEMVKRAKRH